MKRLMLALAVVLGLVGFIGIETAEAVFVSIAWRTKEVSAITSPQMYDTSVFSEGTKVAGNLPPFKGGGIVILDITDRTRGQLGYLDEDPSGSYPRYILQFTPSTAWMEWQLYYNGFITTTWSRIRGAIWDRKLNRSLAGKESRYSLPEEKADDACKMYCDYEACQEIDINFSQMGAYCTCEEYEGRWFCHKRNRLTYSDIPDAE